MKSIAVVVSITLTLAAAACAPAKSPAELERGLESADASVRRNSADDLRDGDRVPPDAVPKLYAAIDKEQNPEAYGAMLITLGASGSPEAKPYICRNIGGGASGDERMARWAGHALTLWLQQNRDQAGCTGMSSIDEVPKSQGPQPTKSRPVAPKAGIFSPGM